MPAPSVLDRREIHRGRVFTIGVERVRLPNGAETELEILRHPGASAIVPLTANGEILMIRQYRHAAGGYLWEVPAGTLAGGEEPLACAYRELEEEAGVRAAEMHELGYILPAPGYASEKIFLFLARDLTPVRQHLDADEVIAEVRAVPVAEALGWVADGSLVDAKSAVAIVRARERGLLGVAGGAR